VKYAILFFFTFLHSQNYDFATSQFEVNNRQDFGKSFVGLSAPGFYLKDLNNNDFFLSENLNKPIIINFFNTQCAPCMQEMPLLIEFYKSHKKKINLIIIDVAEYSLSSSTKKRETAEDVQKAFKRVFNLDARNLPFSILIDQYSVASINYNVVDAQGINSTPIPVTFFVNSSGIILWEHRKKITEKDLTILTRTFNEIFN
jgi:thiol-disulfide isomerase/thioredoxin